MNALRLNGVHHISCITGDAPGNVRFYVGVLGMRLIKKTVNQDDPSVYHLFYGDENGSPGFDLTFFEYPGARPGRAASGMVHRILWRLPSAESLGYWQERLAGAGTQSELVDPDPRLSGTGIDTGEKALRFVDPEGLGHEFLVYEGEDQALIPLHSEVPPEHAIAGFHGVNAFSSAPEGTEVVLSRVLGFEDLGSGAWKVSGESRMGIYLLDPAPEGQQVPGAGTVHHIAWASRLEDQDQWQSQVSGSGLYATPVIDRFYFRAVYFREPSGVLFELATMGPGFTTDEPAESLGERLSLPPDFEAVRDQVEPHLKTLPDVRQWRPSESS
ncbi:MAG: VOC family protein [Solirubrobacterales bacterium]